MAQHSGSVGARRLGVGGPALAVLAAVTVGSYLSAADEPPADEYVRVEVRGVLQKSEDGPKPAQKGYRIMVGRGEDARQYRLVLTDDEETQRAAALLVGKVVVAAGDLQIKEETSFETRAGRRYVIGEVRVKTLKKAEPPKEKKEEKKGGQVREKKGGQVSSSLTTP
ncbi:MAG: hypothetical protein ACJ8F7_18785 [Gemmataceae bacterium]